MLLSAIELYLFILCLDIRIRVFSCILVACIHVVLQKL